MPAEGQSFDDYLSGRFGSAANVAPVLQYLAAEGQGLGIDFRFDKLRHVPNTVVVHQVMQLAEDLELDQSALADDLMSAFFEEGRNIGDTRELMAIAGTHGISADDASKAIDSDQIKQRVLTREGRARASGLAGVPGFLVNRRLLVVGAQSAGNIVNAFDQAMFGEGSDSLGSLALH
jgi:predicted DsbA family dithiol-disulfide isomerase